jgi:hypothetical protein
MIIYIGLSALAGWMMGFIMGRMSQPSATLTPSELMPEQVKTLKVEKGDTIILRYPGVFRPEQREAVHRMFAERYKDQEVEVLVLEAGLDADVMKKREGTDDLPPPKPKQWTSNWVKDEYCDKLNEIQNAKWEADMAAWKRRRDDNRQHTQPEGDWEEKA